jgi:uncharacterized protein YbbK (DUF523 family)
VFVKLVSACLLGVKCRYDGKDKLEPELAELVKRGELLLPVCPEQLGGLPTPRERAWIVGGDGHDVLCGRARVLTEKRKDVTTNFIAGAEEVWRLAKLFGVEEAILRSRSPSCGHGEIYEPFSEKLRVGEGVTSALLIKNGIKVLTEREFLAKM